jgi:hypothetical protein
VTSVIIATRNLIQGNRDIKRLLWQWVSLQGKAEVIIVDGSGIAENKLIRDMFQRKGADVRIIHEKQDVLNLPKLWNLGIREAQGEHILISGADFLYAPDFFDRAKEVHTPERLVMCMCHELPNIGITEGKVKDWAWNWANIQPFFKANPKLANGIQYGTKKLFLDVPFDERMEKLGGMDNLQAYKCEREGYEPFWWEQKLVLHQWHPISRMKFDKQFNENQKVISEYLNQSNDPPNSNNRP